MVAAMLKDTDPVRTHGYASGSMRSTVIKIPLSWLYGQALLLVSLLNAPVRLRSAQPFGRRVGPEFNGKIIRHIWERTIRGNQLDRPVSSIKAQRVARTRRSEHLR